MDSLSNEPPYYEDDEPKNLKPMWGGKREGSGRKNKGRTQTSKTVRIDNDLVDWLADFPNQGKIINTALREYKTKLETQIKEVDELQ